MIVFPFRDCFCFSSLRETLGPRRKRFSLFLRPLRDSRPAMVAISPFFAAAERHSSRSGVISSCFCGRREKLVSQWCHFALFLRPQRDIRLAVVSFRLVFAAAERHSSRSGVISSCFCGRRETFVSQWCHFVLFLRPQRDIRLAVVSFRLVFAAAANHAALTGRAKGCLRRRRGRPRRCGPTYRGAGPRNRRTTWRRS